MSAVDKRFWSKVDKSGECWVWTASLDLHGYGRYSAYLGNRKTRGVKAHRYSYTLAHGPIADGMHILHSCDNPKCVNPDHLRVGTQADNGRDMASRRRSLAGERHNLAKLNARQVLEIRALGRSITGATLAQKYGVSQATISMIRSGKIWPEYTVNSP